MKIHFLNKALRLIITSFAFTMLFSSATYAFDCVWTNGNANGLWSESGNWTDCNSTIPQSADTVTLDATNTDNITIDTPVDIATFTLESTYTGTVSGPGIATQSFETGEFFLQGASATFNASNLNMTIDGASSTSAFNFDAGVFTAPSSGQTFIARGGWDFENGTTFNHNNGTVTVEGSIATTTWDYGTNDLNLYNLNIDLADGSILRLGNGVDLDVHVANTLTLTDGILNERSNTAHMYADGTISWGNDFDGGDSNFVFNTTTATFIYPDVSAAKFTTNGCFEAIVGDTNTVTVETGAGTTSSCLQGITVNNGSFDNTNFDANMTIDGPVNANSGGSIDFGTGNITFNAVVDVNTGSSLSAGENGAGVVTFQNELNVDGGTFDISETNAASSTFALGTAAIDINGGTFISTPGIFTIIGGWDHDGGTFTHSSGTLSFEGALASTFMDLPVSGATFYNIRINKNSPSNAHVLRNGSSDTYTVENDITIMIGTLDVGSTGATINLEGDWTLCPSVSNSAACASASPGDAVFDPDNRTVNLTGTNQSIHGDNNDSFYDLVKTTATGDTLYFEAGEEVRVINSLTLTGTSGNLLALKSTGYASNTPASIDPEGTVNIDYVSIEDVNNTRGTDIDLSSNAENTDLGQNNTGWIFANPFVANAIPEFSTYLLLLTMLAGCGMIYRQKFAPVRVVESQ